jgi:hypothetical protein
MVAAAGVSAFLALATGVTSDLLDYREWSAISLPVYLLAGILGAAGVMRKQAGASRLGRASLYHAGLKWAILGAFLIPLAAEVVLQATTTGVHAQPEVATIEQAGRRLVETGRVYLSPAYGRGSDLVHSRPMPLASYFPYFPAMALFGLPAGFRLPGVLSDARLLIAGFSVLMLVVASRALALDRSARLELFFWFCGAAWGALPLVTGGDDVAVATVCLAGAALLIRGAPLAAGVVMGAGVSMKATCLPAALALGLIRSPRPPRRNLVYAGGLALVSASFFLPFLLTQPYAVLVNAVQFPLNLAGRASPAASALPGHLLAEHVPGAHGVLVGLMALLGLGWLAWLLARRPAGPGSALARAGLLLLAFALLSPATRFGYLLYPVDFLFAAHLLWSLPGDH